MDSYFKAAVCDLDKLLDEFEQNTDECECFRTPQSPYESKLSSVLDCLEHAHPTPGQPEDPARCPAPEQSSLCAPAGMGSVLSYSPPKEKGVAGPDLLSTLDSRPLSEAQALKLGRCSIPVCDLVSDTANLIHSVSAAEGAQKLQRDDLQDIQGPAGCDMSCVPLPTCVTSPGCTGAASTSHSDGDSVLQDIGHLTTEQSNNFALKSENYAAGAVLGLCNDHHRTEPMRCSEILDHPGQAAALDTECVIVAPHSLNAYSPKDEKACEKLPLESQDNSTCYAASTELCGGNAIGEVDPNNGSNADSMPSDLPKRHLLHNSNTTSPGNCVSLGCSCQIGAEVELEKKGTEENVDKELNSSEIVSSVSGSCMSAEDVQASLSCLSLPVSMCGSSVVTEEKVNPLPQNAVAEVINDPVTVHAAESKIHLPGKESCENTSWHQQEDLTEMNESIAENSKDGEKCSNENVTDDGDSQQIKAFASGFLDLGAEPSGVVVDTFYDESMSSVMADFTVEEDVIKSDILISDAELDDFLYGQSVQSSVLKSSDNDGNLMEADADGGNLTDLNTLDFTEVNEEFMQTKLEEIMSIDSNLKASVPGSEVEAAAKVSMSHSQGMTESGSGAVASDVCTKRARPKQLLDLSQGAAGQKQLNKIHEPERENQESGSVTAEAPLSDTGVNVGNYSDAGESSSEAGGSQTSESSESRRTPAVLSWKQPLWVPDSEAPNCMNCQAKFTFTKRRHHCRACGKVFCGSCCKRKCKLQYMEKEARVCTGCYDDINRAQAFERMMSPTGPVPNSSVSSEHSPAVPPVEEAQVPGSASSPSPSALLPISALKQPGPEGLCPREQKRVWFADGILPNGEVADTAKLSSGAKRSQDSSPVNVELPETPMVHLLVEEHPCHQKVTLLLGEGGPNPLTFILNENLLFNVKLITSKFIKNMENITSTENFLSNKEHGGFLLVSPILQKLDELILPDNPFCCGILIHKVEIPWAKVFAIRLMLRLGAEYGVDGKSMEGNQSEKAPQYKDFEREGKVIKCTEVYCFAKDHEQSSAVAHQFAKEIAVASNTALCPHLKTLKNNGMSKIGLRVSIDSDMVEYLAGSGGHVLPRNYLNDLDSALIPVIHGGMSHPAALPLKMEFSIFHYRTPVLMRRITLIY